MAARSPSYIVPQDVMYFGHNGSHQTAVLPSKSLYVSHFISMWNSRGFEFGAVLFLANIYPGTLLPMSIYALLRATAATFLGNWVGHYIDTSPRLQVVRLSILGQRVPVVLSCIGFLVLLAGGTQLAQFWRHAIFSVMVLLACMEKLCSMMNTVAVERDWVVVIAAGDDDVLKEMNSHMRQIDLFCKLISPLVIALIDGISPKLAVLITLGLNATTVVAEYFLIAEVHHRTPALNRNPQATISNSGQDEEGISLSGDPETYVSTDVPANNPRAKPNVVSTYLTSNAFLPSFSLSILYFTVLSFSGQMTAYLLTVPSPHLSSTTVGVLRTISTIFELSSTFAAPRLMSKIGPVRAGIWCLSWQAICLTCGVAILITSSSSASAPVPKLWLLHERATYLNNTKSGVIALTVTVMLSRIGLWSFDLVAQLLIQNSTDPTQRGTFSSMEASLQNLFELCTFATTIVWSRPEQFKYPAMMSVVAVWIAGGCYAKFVRDQRGHLLHLPPCLNVDWSFGAMKSRRSSTRVGGAYGMLLQDESSHDNSIDQSTNG